MTNETEVCPVDHDERRAMGMQFCYHCDAYLQSEVEALSVKERRSELNSRPDGETWLSVERWILGDTEERSPMYCLYLRGPKGGWLRIGDVWDQEGADYLNALESTNRDAAAREQGLRTALAYLLTEWLNPEQRELAEADLAALDRTTEVRNAAD